MTQTELDILLKRWQKILRLQDWDITVTYAPWHEVHDKAVAHLHYHSDRREARLAIRDPQHQPKVEPWTGDNDDELSIVHELLHLKFHRFQAPPGEEEPIIEQLAKTLLHMMRGTL